jgi:MFS family permease
MPSSLGTTSGSPIISSLLTIEPSSLQESDCISQFPEIIICSYTDAYDLFAVNFANIMIGYVYYSNSGGALPSALDTALKISTVVGTIFGQLGFGYLADHLGRKKVLLQTINRS